MARALLNPGDLPTIPRLKINQIISTASPVATSVTTTPVTLTDDDSVVLVDDDTVGSAVTVNLPAAASNEGVIFTIKKLGTTGSVTIDASGSETIDGATTLVISAQYESPRIYCNGSAWFVI